MKKYETPFALLVYFKSKDTILSALDPSEDDWAEDEFE